VATDREAAQDLAAMSADVKSAKVSGGSDEVKRMSKDDGSEPVNSQVGRDYNE
jgi:hypothetical protein